MDVDCHAMPAIACPGVYDAVLIMGVFKSLLLLFQISFELSKLK